MKKLFIIPAIILLAILISCGGNKDKVELTPGMMQLDLSKYGIPITITTPDSSKGPVEVITQSWGATEIKIGKDFQISISEGEGDIELAKSDIKSNDVNKFKRYIVQEPNILMYESEIIQPEFHLYAIIKTEKATYIVEDIKGDIFSEQAIKLMLEAAKSIKLKSVEAKAS